MVMKLNRGACGLSLRDGSLSIAFTYLIGMCSTLVGYIAYLKGRLYDVYLTGDECFFLYLEITVLVVLLCFNILLVIGIVLENPTILMSWIVAHILYFIYIMGKFTVSFYVAVVTVDLLYGIGVLVFYISILWMMAYSILVVTSYLAQVKLGIRCTCTDEETQALREQDGDWTSNEGSGQLEQSEQSGQLEQSEQSGQLGQEPKKKKNRCSLLRNRSQSRKVEVPKNMIYHMKGSQTGISIRNLEPPSPSPSAAKLPPPLITKQSSTPNQCMSITISPVQQQLKPSPSNYPSKLGLNLKPSPIVVSSLLLHKPSTLYQTPSQNHGPIMAAVPPPPVQHPASTSPTLRELFYPPPAPKASSPMKPPPCSVEPRGSPRKMSPAPRGSPTPPTPLFGDAVPVTEVPKKSLDDLSRRTASSEPPRPATASGAASRTGTSDSAATGRRSEPAGAASPRGRGAVGHRGVAVRGGAVRRAAVRGGARRRGLSPVCRMVPNVAPRLIAQQIPHMPHQRGAPLQRRWLTRREREALRKSSPR